MNSPIISKILCPKCGSSTTFIERDYSTKERILSCFMCGMRAYGDIEIHKILLPQIEAAREKVSFPSPSSDHKYVERLCNWKDCNKDSGSRRRARANSKYCSRDCSNKNARYRYLERKKIGG